jgi:hypothetical protein
VKGQRVKGKRQRAFLRSLGPFALFLFPFALLHADITGTVTITGKPNSKDETFYAPVTGCGEGPTRHTENWKISPKGALGDVVVWIADPKFKTFDVVESNTKPPEVEIRQLGCRYVPHVIAVQSGAPFKIINGDPTLHNVRANASNGPGQPPGYFQHRPAASGANRRGEVRRAGSLHARLQRPRLDAGLGHGASRADIRRH